MLMLMLMLLLILRLVKLPTVKRFIRIGCPQQLRGQPKMATFRKIIGNGISLFYTCKSPLFVRERRSPVGSVGPSFHPSAHDDDAYGCLFSSLLVALGNSPKTGGSSIIQASLTANVTWGDCLFRNLTRTFYCSAFSIHHRPCSHVQWQGCTKHLPMQYLHRFEKHTRCNPYDGSDIFTVVRNPFERVLSEFYYNCLVAKQAICKPNRVNDANYMNEAIQKRLLWRFNNCASPSRRCYFANCNHDIAQSDYIYDTRTAATTNTMEEKDRPVQLVQWVLHLERIQDEFMELMRRYGLQDTVHLPKQRLNAGKNNLLTVANFTPATIEWITKVYSKDFEAFGYSKVPP